MGHQVQVTEELHDYMVAHGMPLDEIATELVAETQAARRRRRHADHRRPGRRC